jgi:Holliday junction resolvase
MNSKQKGKRGERAFAAALREEGYHARRGVQYQGGPESPDVVVPDMPDVHWEVKFTQRLNLRDAVAQAEGECKGKKPVVAHKWNNGPWLCILKFEDLMDLYRRAGPSEKK